MIASTSMECSMNTERIDYHIELSMVKHGTDNLSGRLERFASKFTRVIAAGHDVALPDNAMGKLTFQGHELIRELQLKAPSGRIMVHLNTFHSLSGLHEILDSCGELDIRDLLIVSGDGSCRLPRLCPADLKIAGEAVTSVELLDYIRRLHGDFFHTGVAFNQYEPPSHERDKLMRKLDAGAEFVITQPVIASTPVLDELRRELPVPLILEAWMSPRIELLYECVGGVPPSNGDVFDPIATLRRLETYYADSGFYLALLNFDRQFDLIVK